MSSMEDEEGSKLVPSEDSDCSPCCSKCPETLKVDKKLLPFKALFLFFYGSIGSIIPFLSVFYKQVGLSPTYIGVLSGVKPIVGSISSPLLGSLGDRFKIRKAILLLATVAWMVDFLIIAHLPRAAESHTCPIGLPPKTNASDNRTSLENELIHGYRVVIGWMFQTSDVIKLFWAIFVLTMIGEVMWSPIGALQDVALMSELGSQGMHKYSKQRAWGAFGMAVFQLFTGAVLNTTVKNEEACGLVIPFTNYRVAFYIFACGMFLTLLISITIKFKYDKADERKHVLEPVADYQTVPKSSMNSIISDHESSITDDESMSTDSVEASGSLKPANYSFWKLVRFLCSVHYASWVACIVYMGLCNGVITGFLFWYLEALGGNTVLMGVAGAVATGTEFIFFFFAQTIVVRIGAINTLYISVITYAIRFTNYTIMVNPWLVLPSEVLQGFTSATAWAALAHHASEAVPSRYLGSIMGLVHGTYWGFGHGVGFLLGGVSINELGGKNTFGLLIGTSLGFCILFFIAQKLSTRPTFEEEEEQSDNDS